MSELRLLTAGESHGKALVAILEGIPAGLPLTEDFIAVDLRRRQGGHGRSRRQQLEQDHAERLREHLAERLENRIKHLTSKPPDFRHRDNELFRETRSRQLPTLPSYPIGVIALPGLDPGIDRAIQ